MKHTVAHDKLWDEVDAPVSAATVLVFFIKLLAKVVVELAEGAHGCALAAVVVVAVHVQHLLAGHREQAGEHALLEACAKHNHIILLILSGKQALGQRGFDCEFDVFLLKEQKERGGEGRERKRQGEGGGKEREREGGGKEREREKGGMP